VGGPGADSKQMQHCSAGAGVRSMLKTEGRGLNGSYNRTSPGPASLRSGGTSPCFEVGRPKYNKIHNKNFTKKSTPVSVPEGKGWAAQCPGLFDFKDRQMTHRGTPSGCPSAVRITTNHEIPQARLCPKSSSDYPHISKERRTGYQRDKSSLRSWDGQGFGPPTPGDDTPKNGGGGGEYTGTSVPLPEKVWRTDGPTWPLQPMTQAKGRCSNPTGCGLTMSRAGHPAQVF
jgi:hypothetical protein